MSQSFDEFEIYDNTYMILNKPFVSPLSEFGYGVYLYVLSDTIQKMIANSTVSISSLVTIKIWLYKGSLM